MPPSTDSAFPVFELFRTYLRQRHFAFSLLAIANGLGVAVVAVLLTSGLSPLSAVILGTLLFLANALGGWFDHHCRAVLQSLAPQLEIAGLRESAPGKKGRGAGNGDLLSLTLGAPLLSVARVTYFVFGIGGLVLASLAGTKLSQGVAFLVPPPEAPRPLIAAAAAAPVDDPGSVIKIRRATPRPLLPKATPLYQAPVRSPFVFGTPAGVSPQAFSPGATAKPRVGTAFPGFPAAATPPNHLVPGASPALPSGNTVPPPAAAGAATPNPGATPGR